MNMKSLLLAQYIMFCGMWVKSASLVHWIGKTAFLRIFSAFLVIYFIIYYLYINEEVNIYEQYGDSMCQFALCVVNK